MDGATLHGCSKWIGTSVWGMSFGLLYPCEIVCLKSNYKCAEKFTRQATLTCVLREKKEIDPTGILPFHELIPLQYCKYKLQTRGESTAY